MHDEIRQLHRQIAKLKEEWRRYWRISRFALVMAVLCAVYCCFNDSPFERMRREPVVYVPYYERIGTDVYAEATVHDVEQLDILVSFPEDKEKSDESLSTVYYRGRDDGGGDVYFSLPLGKNKPAEALSGQKISGRTYSLRGASVTGNLLRPDFDMDVYFSQTRDFDSVYHTVKRVTFIGADMSYPQFRLVAAGLSVRAYAFFAAVLSGIVCFFSRRKSDALLLKIHFAEKQLGKMREKTSDLSAGWKNDALTGNRAAALQRHLETMQASLHTKDKETAARMEKHIEAVQFSISAEVERVSRMKEVRQMTIDADGPVMQAMLSGYTGLESVVIMEGATHIGKEAFIGCPFLKTITLPSSLRSIGEGAFAGCAALTEIKLPKRLEWIGARAFAECGFRQIDFPQSMLAAAPGAFENCADLQRVHVKGDWFIPRAEMFPGTPWEQKQKNRKQTPYTPVRMSGRFPQVRQIDGRLIMQDARGSYNALLDGETAVIAVIGKEPLRELAVRLDTGRLVRRTRVENGQGDEVPVSREEALQLLAELPERSAERQEAQAFCEALCEALSAGEWRDVLLSAPVTRNRYTLCLLRCLGGMDVKVTPMDDPGPVLSGRAAAFIVWEDVTGCSVSLDPGQPDEPVTEVRIDLRPVPVMIRLEDGKEMERLQMTRAELQHIRALISCCELAQNGRQQDGAVYTLCIHYLGGTFLQRMGGDKVRRLHDEACAILRRALRIAA